MRQSEVIELIRATTALPPTLTAELLEALPTLPNEKVGWIVSILQQAHIADVRYQEAAARIEELLAANKVVIEREVTVTSKPVLEDIMAEFEEELGFLEK